MGEVVELNIATTVDIPAAKVLTTAIEHGLKDVVIAGIDENGELYFAGSTSDCGQTLLLLELAKKRLLEISDGL